LRKASWVAPVLRSYEPLPTSEAHPHVSNGRADEPPQIYEVEDDCPELLPLIDMLNSSSRRPKATTRSSRQQQVPRPVYQLSSQIQFEADDTDIVEDRLIFAPVIAESVSTLSPTI
jgi:hypothetical protein